ncbi:MAG TPA: 4-oxalocrotonate tautomerase [Clostridiales bacterium]|nr:4-oxalocrotonate tautomerase [Clostridiales bacterium]
MPHVIVKMYPGRTEEQKQELCSRMTEALMETLKVGVDSISIGIEEISPENWTEAVYKPDILGKQETLYKKPGYQPK